jgi:hypothetical protein
VTKRISCRVIKSVPLVSNGCFDLAAILIADNSKSNEDASSAGFHVRHCNNQARLFSQFDMSKKFIRNNSAGRILDFYV